MRTKKLCFKGVVIVCLMAIFVNLTFITVSAYTDDHYPEHTPLVPDYGYTAPELELDYSKFTFETINKLFDELDAKAQEQLKGIKLSVYECGKYQFLGAPQTALTAIQMVIFGVKMVEGSSNIVKNISIR